MDTVNGTESCLGRTKLDELEYLGSMTTGFIAAPVLGVRAVFSRADADSEILRIVITHLHRSSLTAAGMSTRSS